MNLIWATRGRSWGSRFLLLGGLSDPLRVYESAFSGLEDERVVFRRVGGRVTLRVPDPLGRQDDSGRPILHDFVVLEPLATHIRSYDDGLRLVWPLVAEFYDQVWDGVPPTAQQAQAAIGSGSRRSPDAGAGPDPSREAGPPVVGDDSRR